MAEKKRAPAPGSAEGSKDSQTDKAGQENDTPDASTIEGQSSTSTLLPKGFTLAPDGIFKRINKKQSIRVCSPLRVVADTRDATGASWGRLLVFQDRDGKPHRWPVPMSLLAGDGREFREALLNLGLEIEQGKSARDGLTEYVSKSRPARRALCVSQIGWHNDVFVFPDATIGTSPEQVVLQAGALFEHAFHCNGTLQSWQDNVAIYAVDNSRLVLSLCTAAAAPLLKLVRLESGGFHFYGSSSIGKTTGLRMAGSFFGGGGKKNEYHETWRTTDNGIEVMAVAHNDTLLCLDELSQVDPRAAAAAAYMLTNGQGKQRANQRGGGEPVTTWQLMFLSNGEMTLGDKIAEDTRQKRTAGQAVRVIDINADAGAEHGIFETLHQFSSGSHLSDYLKRACADHYGVASREFIAQIAQNPTNATQRIKEVSERFINDHCTADVDGQVRRVAARFAHVAAAGELAIELGIFPWPTGQAIRGVGKCFKSWLKSRGGKGCFEEIEGLKQVTSFLQMHGSSRFEPWNEDHRIGNVHNRIGWRKDNGDGEYDYVVTPAGLKEMTLGYDSEKIAQALREKGLLIPDGQGKNSKSMKPPGYAQLRLYHIPAKALSYDLAERDNGDAEHL